MDVPKDIGARYLCQAERILIADRRGAGDSIRAIARRLGRPASTVSREVRGNSDPGAGCYGPYRAQQAAADRRKRPKARKARVGTRLWDEIRAGIKRHWSPEQTGHRLDADFPDNGDMHACTETIYQAIYIQGRGELNREPMVMNGERPAEVGDRAVPGHWEGDPVCGRANRTAIGTLVERATRFTIPPAPARRTRRRTRPTSRHPQDARPEQAPAPVLPQRHRPIRLPGGLPRRGRRGTQRPATKTLGFMKPSEKIIELLDAA